MLIDLKEIIQKYNLNIKGVIQVGAHFCEEHSIYVELGIENIMYVEPCKESFDTMIKKVFNDISYDDEKIGGHFLYKGMWLRKGGRSIWYVNHDNIKMLNCACGDIDGSAEMYASPNNQGQSNSLLKPALHLHQHPEVVFTDSEAVYVVPLDELPFKKEEYNLLNMDVQGAEGLVLKGATETLKHIDCIYTEINTDYTYENNMLVGEMDELLSDFERVETFMPSPNLSWGDAVYIRKSLL